MDLETPLAESIHISAQNAQCDAICKRILSEKWILAWILKRCVVEFCHFDVKEIAEKYIEGDPQISDVPVLPDLTNAPGKIHGRNTEDSSLTEGKITYDILFLAILPSSRERIRIIINVEAQGKFYPGYPLIKRGIYHCCRMISSQYNSEFTGARYQDIKKVYSIWIAMNPPKERENTITRYRIVEENMVGNVKELPQNYDLMTVIMVCLGSPNQGDSDILRLLNVLFSNEIEVKEKKLILSEDFDIPMTHTLEGRLLDMCDFSVGFEERGWRRGRKEGKIERNIEIARNLIKMGLSPDQISMATGLSVSEINNLR